MRTALVLVFVLAVTSSLPARCVAQDRVAAPTADDLTTWLDAVEHHVGGEFDGAASEIAPWHLSRLERVLRDLGGAVSDGRLAIGLTRDELRRRDATRVLMRAALLHTDIAVLAEEHLRFGTGSPRSSGGRTSVTILDGRFNGYDLDSDHWAFARRLLHRVRPKPQVHPIVRDWYRAVALRLVSTASFGELERHLADGRQLYRRDAVLAMVDGAMHQAFASPRVQAALGGIAVPQGQALALEVGGRSAELDRARRAYEDALRDDPGLVEARIRLARVLADADQPADAAALLRDVSTDNVEAVLSYYSALILGEQEMRLGRAAEARTCFERASSLFPLAQSPLLAMSHLARARGDGDGALAALDRLTHLPARAGQDDDPWWSFLWSPGRHAAAELTRIRAHLGARTSP